MTLDTLPVPQDDTLLAWVGDGIYPAPHGRPKAPTIAEVDAAAEPEPDEIGLAMTGELEPCIAAAIREAIIDTIDGIDAARESRGRLERAGDPLGLMDGDGSCSEPPDTNAPSPERVASRGTFEIVSATTAAGRDSKSEAWRHLPVVEAMIRRGQIGKDHAAAYMEAARRFYRDFVDGHRGVRVTSRYGELSGSGGTPASQQIVRTYLDRFGREHDVAGPEDRRHDAHTAWWRACHAVGVTRCLVTGRPVPGETLQWMLVLVCEDYHVATERTPSLEDAGRAVLGYRSPVQASAAGAALIKSGLERLVVHYGIEA